MKSFGLIIGLGFLFFPGAWINASATNPLVGAALEKCRFQLLRKEAQLTQLMEETQRLRYQLLQSDARDMRPEDLRQWMKTDSEKNQRSKWELLFKKVRETSLPALVQQSLFAEFAEARGTHLNGSEYIPQVYGDADSRGPQVMEVTLGHIGVDMFFSKQVAAALKEAGYQTLFDISHRREIDLQRAKPGRMLLLPHEQEMLVKELGEMGLSLER